MVMFTQQISTVSEKEKYSYEYRCRQAQEKLIIFTQETHPNYQANWHHIIISRALEAVEKQKIKYLLIMMPPQNGKSELASIRFPAWYLGKHPDKFIISTSYNAEMATDFGRSVRNLIADETYQVIFDKTKLAMDKKAASMWYTNAGGRYLSAGINGSITGKGAHILLIDDPVKNWEEASSSRFRDRTWNWFQSTAETRLRPDVDGGGAIVVIMTWWHQDDLAGRILEEKQLGKRDWRILKLPAIATENEQFRKIGEVLWPQKYPLEWLLAYKERTSKFIWNALYQCNAISEEGNIIKRSHFKYYKELPRTGVDANGDPVSIPYRKIQSWDTAEETKAQNDYSVCETWGEYEKGFYLIDLWRQKVEYPELLKAIKTHAAKHRPDGVLIEKKSTGSSAIKELRREGKIDVVSILPLKSKMLRVQNILPALESGNVYLPDPDYFPDCDWVDDFVNECVTFDAGKYDDMVDSMSQALAYLRRVAPSITVF